MIQFGTGGYDGNGIVQVVPDETSLSSFGAGTHSELFM